jgi:hypothetical protein
MEYALIWHSQYGKEEVDTTTDKNEARRLKKEYQMAAVTLKLSGSEVTLKLNDDE